MRMIITWANTEKNRIDLIKSTIPDKLAERNMEINLKLKNIKLRK